MRALTDTVAAVAGSPAGLQAQQENPAARNGSGQLNGQSIPTRSALAQAASTAAASPGRLGG